MKEEKFYPRRWGVLAALFLALFGLQFSFICPGGCALDLMMAYNCDATQFSMIMSVPYFCGVLFGVVAGTAADRIGINKVLAIGFIVAIIGCTWRMLTIGDYLQLFLSSMVMGFATACLNANNGKIIRAWFPGESAGVAFGVYVAAASLGAMVAIQVGARVGMDFCWKLSVGLFVFALIAWFILYRDHPEGNLVDEPISQHLGAVLKNPHVWGLSIYTFIFMGATVIGTTFMVAGLQVIYGADGCDAGSAANLNSINSVAVLIGCVVLPAVVAKFKWMRGITIVLLILAGVGYAGSFYCGWNGGILPAVLLVIGGLAFGPLMSAVKLMPTVLPSINLEHLGAIGGVQSTFQNLGMFLVSSYIISPIAMSMAGGEGPVYYQYVFAGILVCMLLSAACLFLMPNLRTSVPAAMADRAAAEAAKQK